MQLNPEVINGLTGARALAWKRWRKNGWPDHKAEQWRFTRLNDLKKLDLRPADNVVDQPEAGPILTPFPDKVAVLSFSHGVLDPKCLSALPTGVEARLLDENDPALATITEIVPQSHPISDLSLAMMSSGIHFEIFAKVETPIIFVFTGDNGGVSSHPVVSVRVREGASAVLGELHQANVGLSAPLIAIEIEAGARLDYAKVQQDSCSSSHLAATGLKLGEGSVFDGFQISVGGKLARLETHITLSGENADCTLSAVYLGRKNQHHDITTNMSHNKGHCLSNQIIRGVLDDSARGVFQGKVHVAPDAQKTDGQQMSRALLLSRKAKADAKPELEIYADDVLCAHGATVGELDETQLFYLMSRGIDRGTALAILISAFLDDAIDSFGHVGLADMLLRPVASKWMSAVGAQLTGDK